jgi:hypothetical protein
VLARCAQAKQEQERKEREEARAKAEAEAKVSMVLGPARHAAVCKAIAPAAWHSSTAASSSSPSACTLGPL